MTVLEELAHGAYESNYYVNALVLETKFSKEELQDSATINKILNSKNYFDSIGKFMVFIIGIISFVASLVFLAIPTFFMGPLCIAMLFGSAYSAIDAYPANRKDKQLKQLQDQCLKLSVKMEHACHKNPDKESTYREIMKNCNKVSDAVDAYYEKTSNDKFMDEVDDAIRIYQTLLKWLKNPFVFEDTELFGMFYLAELLGIDEKTIASQLPKGGKPTCNLRKDWFSEYNEPPKNIVSVVPELFDNSCVYEIYENDDKGLWYSPKAHSFITNDERTDSLKRVSLYSFVKEYADLYPDQKAFVEADKNLGYYQLSNCPKAVQRKPLIY